jgi:ribosomal protein S18 acetylase RimI-like enzyme
MDESMKHPEHERLRQEVRSWFTTSRPGLGYQVERRRFGFYRHRTEHPDLRLIVVDSLTSGEVPEFVGDARRYFSNLSVEIWVDDRALDAAVGPALLAAGCSRAPANVSLAHVGPPPQLVRLPAEVSVEPITAETLMDFALVKLKGFANSEEAPQADTLERELAIRRSEIASIGRLLVARVGAEPASILGYYDGADRSIFNLATRLPFRNRGIAQHLLCRVLADAYDRGCRSVVIGTDPADTPIQLYRRLGFTDEVYWRGAYLLT